MSQKNDSPQKVLLVGYNGANNTGSEARLLSIIKDVKSLLGPHTQITVPTLNEENLRRYLDEDEHLHIAPIPSIFFLAIDRLVAEHDLVLLVEGSCYMDTWTSALLWAFLWATNSAHRHNKPCLAYAVDAGELSSLNRWLVKREASKTDLIITRTKHAMERLQKIGVTAPITSTADCAFTFQEDPEDENFLGKLWPESVKGVVGLAVVDFSLWPVVIRPCGHEKDLYKWPYYFSRSNERKKTREKLIEGWTRTANHIIEKQGKNVALICMEELDQPLAMDIRDNMKNKDKCRVISSGEFNASQMTSMLCELDLLVTSRYHSAVLSLRAGVPQIAVGHDPRLTSFYQDLGLYQEYFICHDAPTLWEDLRVTVDLLLATPNLQKDHLESGLQEQLSLSQKNMVLLQEFLGIKGKGEMK
ncbi:polysaccharide pyruvyl transferase family protein [Methanobacterium sp.]|uniref:polysaccharide pyruvyl transferase family protein n=1 Tax=Methanobacterium sp. TaxID=2164 RepID=UPI0025F0E458|nr:polysaccharide pyruvyl transferase family protein [Methanobacterium sp.]MBI5459526.1 polysaccharide pyruvyl transferase family protein [Methanobacterium sp.]